MSTRKAAKEREDYGGGRSGDRTARSAGLTARVAERRADLSRLVAEIEAAARALARPLQIMEVCGTHTVAIFRSGIRSLLPANVRLVSGPGCPVCVTAQGHVDAMVRLSTIGGALVATYGDMVRVPGGSGSLESRRAQGAEVRVVNSARSALRLAGDLPDRQVIFLGVGFETTTPATAAVVLEAERRGVSNFSVFAVHKLIVPAMLALLGGGASALDGFLCPGHVSVIIGSEAYRPVVERYAKPCVIAGFEPRGILAALLALLRQIERGEAKLENAYEPVVTRDGNTVAQQLTRQTFETVPTAWRGLGVVAASGLELREEHEALDARRRFGIEVGEGADHPDCRCGEVICGTATPDQCPLFGLACTPVTPVGPCMVSSEGTCSAWFKYGPARPEPVRAADLKVSAG